MATINYWGLISVKDSVTVALTITIDQLIAAIAADEGLPTDYYKVSLLNNPAINDVVYGDSSTTLTAMGIVDGDTILCTPNQTGTKEDRQVQKLEIAQNKRQAGGDTSKSYYRINNVYNVLALSQAYEGNGLINDALTINPLADHRPWVGTAGGSPIYTLGASAGSVNEGDTITITLYTVNVANGTSIPYTITGVTTADIEGASLTGNFVVGTVDSITFTTTEDLATEGTETLTLTLDGIGTTVSVNILDTSVPPATIEEIFGDETSGGVVTVLESQFDAANGDNFVPSDPADGQTFTQWTDSNSGTRNANPIGGATTRASYQSGVGDTQNSLAVVRFDGNDGLSINPYPGLASKAGVTVFALLKMNAETVSVNNDSPRVFSTNVLDGIAFYYNSTSNRWTVAASTGVGESTTTNDSSQFSVHTLVYDGAATGNSNRLKYRYNGVEDTLTFTGTVGTTTSASITTLYIGNNNGSNFFTGDIGEFLIFTRTLTVQEISAVESYLNNKWGL